jgi:hypothetical protein
MQLEPEPGAQQRLHAACWIWGLSELPGAARLAPGWRLPAQALGQVAHLSWKG